MSEETILDLVNNAEITADDLLAVNGATETLPKTSRGFEGGMFAVGKICKGDFKKASAIFFKMRALSLLLESEEGIPGWTLPRLPDGSIPAEEAVFAAAATQPLIEVEDELVFERETFMARVLELAEIETHG